MKYDREPLPLRPVADRLHDWEEVVEHGINEPLLKTQSARCMDCGTPFCQQVHHRPYTIRHILTTCKSSCFGVCF